MNGCFWHMHSCQRKRKNPVTQVDYWQAKRIGNVRRDRKNLAKLRREGWSVLVVWECQTRDIRKLAARLAAFLD